MSGHTALIVFAVALFVVGVALLVIAIRGEIKLKRYKQTEVKPENTPATGIVSIPVRANTSELSRPISGKTLPELRPYVIAVSYKQLQHISALGFETQNVGKEAAVEVSIPDVKLGTSIIQFEGNYQRLTVNQSAYWRVLIKHDTGGFSTGNALVNEMRVQGKGEIIVPIHYKNDNNLFYVTWTRLELSTSAESRIAVHNDAQELIKWPAQRTDATFPPTAPRPYLEVEDPIDERHGKTLFHFTNRGKDVAHNIQIAPLTIHRLSVVFAPIPVLAVNESKTTIPTVPGIGITGGHDILNLMEKEWGEAWEQLRLASQPRVDEWKTGITVTYADFAGNRFEMSCDLMVFPLSREFRNRQALERLGEQYKTVEVRNIKFRQIP